MVASIQPSNLLATLRQNRGGVLFTFTDADAAQPSKVLIQSRCCVDGTGLFSKPQGSFCAGIICCASLDPRGYSGPKDLSVTAKGDMECLAQTSDIDKTGSQSSCREVHRDTVVHAMHTWMHLQELPQSAYPSKKLSWVTVQDTEE